MSTKERVTQQLDTMSEAELEQVAEYVAFLKFRAKHKTPPLPDESQLAALYAEFGEEDRELAEEGMSDYAEGLMREDSR